MKNFEIPHSINAFFEQNDDGTVDIKTENGVLSGLPGNILPDDMRDKASGELIINFADYNLIAKKMFNELLNSDQNEQ